MSVGPLVFRAHGHPNVRATHDKTLELTRDAELGAGGTCILGVDAEHTGSCPVGVVRVSITVGRFATSFTAQGNPGWDPSGQLVIRRSDQQRPDTAATHATTVAADLPGEVVAMLRDVDTEIVVSIEREPRQPDSVVIVAPAAADQLDLQRACADTVWSDAVWSDAVWSDAGWPAGTGGRVLVAGEHLPAGLGRRGVVEVYGLPPHLAAAVAAPGAVTADVATLGDETLRGEPLLLRVPVGELPKVLRHAQRHGRTSGAQLTRLPWLHLDVLADLGAPRVSPGARTAWLCLDPAAPVSDDLLRAELDALASSEATTRAKAKLVAERLGVSVNRVYALAVQPGSRERG